MKPRTLLVLAILVVGLGSFIWFYERELPSSDERAEMAKRVLTVEPDDVERLEISWDGQSVQLERPAAEPEAEASEEGDESAASTSREWRLTAPYEARADATAVDGLVSRLTKLEKERTLEDVDRGEAGLTAPRATVRLTAGDEEDVLEVGAEIPASSNMMLAVEGRDEVYVVPASIWTDLTKEPGEWRDKKLFTGNRNDIERLTIQRGAERLLLAKRGKEFWLEAPVVDRADATEVDSLLSTVVGLRAKSFVDERPEDLAALGLEPPRARIEVVLEGRETPVAFEVGGEVAEAASKENGESAGGGEEGAEPSAAKAYYLRTGKQIVTSEAKLLEAVERPVADWRSKKLAATEVYEIDRAEITDGQGTLELVREGGEWRRDGEKIVYGPATDFLYEVTGARAERLADEEGLELGAPRLSVQLIDDPDDEEKEPAIETVEIYSPVGDATPARASGRDAILMLSAETVSGIEEKLSDLRSAEPAPAEEESATGAAAASEDTGESDSGDG